VARYEHNMGRVLGLPSQSVALLAALVLRGPQTNAELRANTDRLHRFADVSSVEGFLAELAERSDEKGGPLVVRLPRAPGARESRWAQLLCGPIDMAALPVASSVSQEDYVAATELAALKAQQSAMQSELATLRELVDRLYSELGIARS
jgi:uncharacterized protein